MLRRNYFQNKIYSDSFRAAELNNTLWNRGPLDLDRDISVNNYELSGVVTELTVSEDRIGSRVTPGNIARALTSLRHNTIAFITSEKDCHPSLNIFSTHDRVNSYQYECYLRGLPLTPRITHHISVQLANGKLNLKLIETRPEPVKDGMSMKCKLQCARIEFVLSNAAPNHAHKDSFREIQNTLVQFQKYIVKAFRGKLKATPQNTTVCFTSPRLGLNDNKYMNVYFKKTNLKRAGEVLSLLGKNNILEIVRATGGLVSAYFFEDENELIKWRTDLHYEIPVLRP